MALLRWSRYKQGTGTLFVREPAREDKERKGHRT